MYVCIYVCVYVYMHACVHACVRAYVRACVCLRVRTYRCLLETKFEYYTVYTTLLHSSQFHLFLVCLLDTHTGNHFFHKVPL